MAYNNDSGNDKTINVSIWGSKNPLPDSENTLVQGTGTPYAGIFDKDGNPIIEPQSGLSLGELCESFQYESVEEGVDSAQAVIHCSNPNILSLPELQYRSLVTLQWGYIPPNPKSYTGKNQPFSMLKTMSIIKRTCSFTDTGVTVTLEFKDPHYFLYLTNPSYVGFGDITPNNALKFVNSLRGGLNGILLGYYYHGTNLSKTTVWFGKKISDEDVKESGNIETQPIQDFNKEHYHMFGNPQNSIRVAWPLQDKEGNILTTSYDVMLKISPDQLTEPIEKCPLYQEMLKIAQREGWTEVRTQDTLANVGVLLSGDINPIGEGNRMQQLSNGANSLFPGGHVYIHGDGSTDLKFYQDIVSTSYKTYTWAGGNGELLTFSVEDDYSITQTNVNKTADIDDDKTLVTKTNNQIAGDPDSEKTQETLNVLKKDDKGTGEPDYRDLTIIDDNSNGRPNYTTLGAEFIGWLKNIKNKSIFFRNSDNNSNGVSSQYIDMKAELLQRYSEDQIPVYGSSDEIYFTDSKSMQYRDPRARSRSHAGLSDRFMGSLAPKLTEAEIQNYILQSMRAWEELVKKTNFDANNVDEIIDKNWENIQKFYFYNVEKEIILYGGKDSYGRIYGYYDQMEGILENGSVDGWYSSDDITGNPYHYEGEGWSAQILSVERGALSKTTGNNSVNTYKVKVRYSLTGEKIINALDPNSGNISLFNDLTRITTHKIKAQATTIGDPLMEATMNIDIQGVGGYSRKWYVTKITHQLDPGRGYTCDIEFKPYSISNSQLMISGKISTQNWLLGIKRAYEQAKQQNPDSKQDNAWTFWDKTRSALKLFLINIRSNNELERAVTENNTEGDYGNTTIRGNNTTSTPTGQATIVTAFGVTAENPEEMVESLVDSTTNSKGQSLQSNK